ncbi:MAG TPA: sulfate ABC transporter permease subunit CysW [Planctomycetota bacterium]|nr:sulfate ABC transporter permease subunit CysW [Planctomycetota bacterium]
MNRNGSQAPFWARFLLIFLALAVAGVLLLAPLLNVLAGAFSRGVGRYVGALADPNTVHAILLTVFVAGIAVAVNTVFGVAASWAIAKYSFPGKSLLVTLIDLPFSVSPVISGLLFVLLFGAESVLGRWLEARGLQVLFAPPGIVLATIFVTFPFVAREVLPLMEAVGSDQEEAAVTLGATGWQAFRYVTLPNVRWGVLYGVLLCTARAMGEFGAVSVVSGRITGQTDTLSLRVDKLDQEYQTQAAFAVASLLLVCALATLLAKNFLEWKLRRALEEAARPPETP